MEPDLILQNAEIDDDDERAVWIRGSVEAARVDGLTFFRASYDPAHNITLLEGWKKQPDDQGEPRFSLITVFR
jgi:hypothetical protein